MIYHTIISRFQSNKRSTSLQYLTGGTLLSRNNEFIVFYRGKDFLPAAVSSAIEQRRNIVTNKLKAENSSSDAVIKQRMFTKAEAALKRTSNKLSMV